MSRREFGKASEGGHACVFPAFLRAGRRIARASGRGEVGALRRQRHAPGCTGLLRWCQASPDQPELLPVREGGPERQMDPPRGHRHAHRDPEQALAQRRWVAPAQDGGYREVLEPVLHHAIEGMGQCAQPEPECVDVPEAAGASVQEQIVLLFLDPVFSRAPVAVHRFVDRLRVGLLERAR